MKFSVAKDDGIEFFETVEADSVQNVADMALQYDISTSVFKDKKRDIAHFECAELIGLDIDNDGALVGKTPTPMLPIEDAKKIFSPFKHIIVTTRSHRMSKNGGPPADRYRIILFLEKPIKDKDDFYATWFWLKDQFPWIDTKCKDPSRFWFKHASVYSLSETGKLIFPIRYTEPDTPKKEGRVALPGERGDLSKGTLQFLEFGTTPGGRNATVYKVARDFYQNLYDFEDTKVRILGSLERNKVISRDFLAVEAVMAIRSAYSKDAAHAPRLDEVKSRAFNYKRIGEFFNKPEEPIDWLVKSLLRKGGVSLIVGIPKIGKTTLVRQMVRDIIKGKKFFGRETKKGPVVHYSFDEDESTVCEHYRDLGVTADEDLILHFGSAGDQNRIEELEEDLIRMKPTIAIVDTMFDMVKTDNVNDYGIGEKLGKFRDLAKKTGCHIMFIHHQGKLPTDKNGVVKEGDISSVLGSQAIAGKMDCVLIFNPLGDSNNRTLRIKGRRVIDFGKTFLKYDFAKGEYALEKKETVDRF